MAKGLPESQVVYVPILKTKEGERRALGELQRSTLDRIRPLLELHEHKERPPSKHVPDVCEGLKSCWGSNRPFYLDGRWVHEDSGRAKTIGTIMKSVEQYRLRAIPVVRIGFGLAAVEQMKLFAAAQGAYLLRVTPSDLKNTEDLDAVVRALGLGRDKVDFMLDYEDRAMSLENDVPLVPHLGEWRTFIAASGTFPKSLSGFDENEWQQVQRTDWGTWRTGVAKPLARRPIYSDYTMRGPGRPPSGGSPDVGLRYTLLSVWRVCRAGKVLEGDSKEMHKLCKQLASSPEFSGEDFSAGDAEIVKHTDARTADGPGNSTDWVKWCVNHHIEFVVTQISPAAA